MKFPTFEEILNASDSINQLSVECINAMQKWFLHHKQNKVLIDISSYSNETVDTVITKINNSGWVAEQIVLNLAKNMKDYRSVPFLRVGKNEIIINESL